MSTAVSTLALHIDTARKCAIAPSGGQISVISRASDCRFGGSREPSDFCTRLLREHQRAPVLQDESTFLHLRNDFPHHTLGESLLIGQAATIVGSHQSYVSLRIPSNWPRNGFRYSSTKCSISASSLLSMSLTSQADKMDFG